MRVWPGRGGGRGREQVHTGGHQRVAWATPPASIYPQEPPTTYTCSLPRAAVAFLQAASSLHPCTPRLPDALHTSATPRYSHAAAATPWGGRVGVAACGMQYALYTHIYTHAPPTPCKSAPTSPTLYPPAPFQPALPACPLAAAGTRYGRADIYRSRQHYGAHGSRPDRPGGLHNNHPRPSKHLPPLGRFPPPSAHTPLPPGSDGPRGRRGGGRGARTTGRSAAALLFVCVCANSLNVAGPHGALLQLGGGVCRRRLALQLHVRLAGRAACGAAVIWVRARQQQGASRAGTKRRWGRGRSAVPHSQAARGQTDSPSDDGVVVDLAGAHPHTGPVASPARVREAPLPPASTPCSPAGALAHTPSKPLQAAWLRLPHPAPLSAPVSDCGGCLTTHRRACRGRPA